MNAFILTNSEAFCSEDPENLKNNICDVYIQANMQPLSLTIFKIYQTEDERFNIEVKPNTNIDEIKND